MTHKCFLLPTALGKLCGQHPPLKACCVSSEIVSLHPWRTFVCLAGEHLSRPTVKHCESRGPVREGLQLWRQGRLRNQAHLRTGAASENPPSAHTETPSTWRGRPSSHAPLLCSKMCAQGPKYLHGLGLSDESSQAGLCHPTVTGAEYDAEGSNVEPSAVKSPLCLGSERGRKIHSQALEA